MYYHIYIQHTYIHTYIHVQLFTCYIHVYLISLWQVHIHMCMFAGVHMLYVSGLASKVVMGRLKIIIRTSIG